MSERIRVRLDFTFSTCGTSHDVRGLERIADFIEAGLAEVLGDDAFPIDLEPGSKMSVTFNPRTKKAG